MHSSKSRTIVRSIALVLVNAFLFNQVAFSAVEIKPVELSFFSGPMLNIKLPESIARIDGSYKAPSGKKTVILFQDAHTNESGQINISKALDVILEKEKIKYVFLEAGTGNDSLSFLREKAAIDKRKAVGLSYIRKGLMSGSEYLDLTSGHSFTLWGVENKDLYWKSLEVYRNVAGGREKFQSYLDKVETAISVLKPRIFNPSLLSFDQKNQAYQKEEISLTDYFVILAKEADKREIPLAYYPHLSALKDLKKKEEAIDFKAANEEQKKAFASLAKEDLEAFFAAEESTSQEPFKISGLNHKEGKAYYALLEEKLGAGNRKIYPELFKYIDYLKEAKKIDPKGILSEQKLLEDQIYASLTRTQDEEKLIKASRNLRNLRGLFNLTLAPDEFNAYKNDPTAYDVVFITGFINKKIMDLRGQYERALFLEEGYEKYVKDAETFYELTLERDKAFVENMLRKMNEEGQDKAVFIAGGYHAPNLKALFKAQNISYVCMTPQILHETNLKRYEKILLSQSPVGPNMPTLNIQKETLTKDTMAVQPLIQWKLSELRYDLEAPETNKVAAARLAESVIARSPQGDEAISTAKIASPLRARNDVIVSGARLATPGSPNLIINDRYEIIKKIGEGGMGAVYLVFDREKQINVALKTATIRNGQLNEIERFKREIDIGSKLETDFIVKVFDSGTFKRGNTNFYFFTMEYMEPPDWVTLEDLIKQEKKFTNVEIFGIMSMIFEGLKIIHDAGIVHRDIKPANIFINLKEKHLKIGDFGLGKSAEDITLTQSHTSLGTPHYMSPEQARGEKADKRADIFSAGVIFYTLLTRGKLPFGEGKPTAASILVSILNDPVKLPVNINPEVDEKLQAICMKAIAKGLDIHHQKKGHSHTLPRCF